MKKKPEEKIDEDWMSTYGDMVTLLLCFFVMMLSVSKPDVAKFEMIQAGMNESLGKKEVTRPIEMMMMELSDDIQSMSAEEDISLGSDTQGVVLEISDDLAFAYGSAVIREEAYPILKKLRQPCSLNATTRLTSALRVIPATKRSPVRCIPPTGNFLRLAPPP
ncbi:MAG: flagellar motor protein MotB [Alphaproteobacteria bacterium]